MPERVCFSSLQYYIDHPEAKILFDAGWKLEEFGDWKGFPQRRGSEGYGVKQETDENPVAQLGKLGVKIDDIDYVIMSHLMCDHAGWLPVFAGKKAQVVVQQQEYDYAQRVGIPHIPGEPAPVEQFHSWMYLRKQYEVPGLKFKLIEGDYELVKDVSILSTPGHTPGSSCLIVDGRLAFVGDLISTAPHSTVQKFFADDWSLIPESLVRLQALRPEWVYSGHGYRPLSGEKLQRLTLHS